MAPSKDPVDLTVHRDAKAIKDTVLSLSAPYNRIITDVDVLTRKDAAVIDQAAVNLTDEEKKKATERLGLLTGETMLSNLKSSMQQIMMNPYPTSRSRELSLLAQIGIATDCGARVGDRQDAPARLPRGRRGEAQRAPSPRPPTRSGNSSATTPTATSW